MFSIATRYNNVSNKINNLDWLDKRENYDYKSFFYINISAKEQEDLITSDNKTFIKELEKKILQHNRKLKLKELSDNFFIRKIKNLFKIKF